MRKSPKLTQERIRELLTYNPETGVFVYAKARRGIKVGGVAGKLKDGYRRICIDYDMYSASTLAWFWVHGDWPSRNLWFKDENRDNTAISNLEYGKTDSKDGDAVNSYRREYWRKNPEKRREKQRKAYYGISQEQYEEMMISQKGVCACCSKPETQFINGRPLPLCVDHCHAGTGVRGLLCQHCNKMLGHAFDKQDILRAGADYLDAHAAKPKTNVIPLAGRRIASGKGE